jgi:hypothetical protein
MTIYFCSKFWGSHHKEYKFERVGKFWFRLKQIGNSLYVFFQSNATPYAVVWQDVCFYKLKCWKELPPTSAVSRSRFVPHILQCLTET